MRRFTHLAAALCLFVGLAAMGCDDNTTDDGREPFAVTNMNGQNEVPPNASVAAGTATLDLASGTVTYKIELHRITGVTAAHIHSGGTGVNGPVRVTLYSGPTTGLVEGVLVQSTFSKADIQGGLSMEQLIADLRNREAYINVHTTAFPNGEIRGQIVPVQ